MPAPGIQEDPSTEQDIGDQCLLTGMALTKIAKQRMAKGERHLFACSPPRAGRYHCVRVYTIPDVGGTLADDMFLLDIWMLLGRAAVAVLVGRMIPMHGITTL